MEEQLCNEAYSLYGRLLAAHWNLRAAGEVIRAERAQRAAETAYQRYWRRAYRWEEAQEEEDEMERLKYDFPWIDTGS